MQSNPTSRSQNQYGKKHIYTKKLTQNKQKGMCAQQRLTSVWAPVQSHQSLCYALKAQQRVLATSMQTAKTLVKLGGCLGLSESLRGAHATLLVCRVTANYLNYMINVFSVAS